MYCRCPEAYRRRYLEREIIPPGIAMLQGTAVHRAAAQNFQQKIESHQDITPTAMGALAASEFESAVMAGVSFTEAEEGRGTRAVLGEAADAAVAMAEFHGAVQAPDYQPILVEHTVRIPLPMASHDLLGIIDLADDQDRVTDFKTSARRKSQADADGSIQLTTYAAAFRAATHRPAKELRLDTIVRLKTKIDRDILLTARDGRDFEALARRINVVSQAIAAGIFPPATAGAWWCSPTWCGYWRTCPYVNSERRAAAESNGEK
jgi:hypothetical protein